MSAKRIKISFAKFRQIRQHNSRIKRHLYFLEDFQEESGLSLTSVRRVAAYPKDHFFFFKIVDKEKYFLSKIKYGF